VRNQLDIKLQELRSLYQQVDEDAGNAQMCDYGQFAAQADRECTSCCYTAMIEDRYQRTCEQLHNERDDLVEVLRQQIQRQLESV